MRNRRCCGFYLYSINETTMHSSNGWIHYKWHEASQWKLYENRSISFPLSHLAGLLFFSKGFHLWTTLDNDIARRLLVGHLTVSCITTCEHFGDDIAIRLASILETHLFSAHINTTIQYWHKTGTYRYAHSRNVCRVYLCSSAFLPWNYVLFHTQSKSIAPNIFALWRCIQCIGL